MGIKTLEFVKQNLEMHQLTSLMTVSRFWDLRGVARGFDREETMWARTSWLERLAD